MRRIGAMRWWPHRALARRSATE